MRNELLCVGCGEVCVRRDGGNGVGMGKNGCKWDSEYEIGQWVAGVG